MTLRILPVESLHLIRSGNKRDMLPMREDHIGTRKSAAAGWMNLLLILGILMAGGCSGPGRHTIHDPAFDFRAGDGAESASSSAVAMSHVFPTIFNLAQGLACQLQQNARQDITNGYPMIVTSSVSIDNLSVSSRFGRVLSESISSELFRKGADIRDIRQMDGVVAIPRRGEMALSRNVTELAKELEASAVLVGTYGLTDSSVIVNIRLIEIGTGRLISVAMAEIARTNTVESMINADTHQMEARMEGPEPTTYDKLQDQE